MKKSYSKPTIRKLTSVDSDFIDKLNLLDVKQTAQFLINNGFRVVPLQPGQKKLLRDSDKDFITIVHNADDFRDDDNLGIMSVGGKVVLDLDSAEAVALADAFVPSTDCIWERDGATRAKRVYRSDIGPKRLSFTDEDEAAKSIENQMLVELRVNHQDMAPPSVHPNGRKLRWVRFGQPAEVEGLNLIRVVCLLSTAVLVARYYPAIGKRQLWCLALSGFLRDLELTEEEAAKVLSEEVRKGRRAG